MTASTRSRASARARQPVRLPRLYRATLSAGAIRRSRGTSPGNGRVSACAHAISMGRVLVSRIAGMVAGRQWQQDFGSGPQVERRAADLRPFTCRSRRAVRRPLATPFPSTLGGTLVAILSLPGPPGVGALCSALLPYVLPPRPCRRASARCAPRCRHRCYRPSSCRRVSERCAPRCRRRCYRPSSCRQGSGRCGTRCCHKCCSEASHQALGHSPPMLLQAAPKGPQEGSRQRPGCPPLSMSDA